jgi:hypothetical protein
MKVYQVTIKKGNATKITYCDYRPKENEVIFINGEKWEVLYFI